MAANWKGAYLKVMSACFSSEMWPLCTPTSAAIHPKRTPSELRVMGKWNGVTDSTYLFKRMMAEAVRRYEREYSTDKSMVDAPPDFVCASPMLLGVLL